jgi:tubulin monoglycylase TTLL3/8
LGHGIDVDRFYPRCFDLGDQVDFENFVENFKFGFAESVAKRFLANKDRYRGLELKIRAIVDILRRRSMNFTTRINAINRA